MKARVFVDEPCAPGAIVRIAAPDARHLSLVLRLQPDDEVTIVAAGVAWNARLVKAERGAANAKIIEPSDDGRELPVPVVILQALPKGNKMDDVIEKVTELGATRVVPMRCARSYGGDSSSKSERWRRIARAAASQSRRLVVPVVDETKDFSSALASVAPRARVMLAWERAAPGSLESALARASANRALALAIGPEGSFTDEELVQARRLHCNLVSLGPTTLRTETAAAAALAAVAALRGWW